MTTAHETEAVATDVPQTGSEAHRRSGVSAVGGLDATSRTALLIAALAGRCEQWALVEATTVVVQRPVDVDVLDPLVALGLAVVEQGWVRVPSNDLSRVVTSDALPSQLQRAHLALAGLASTDALSRGWHLTHAAASPGQEAADLALLTARRLQSTGRSGSARLMLEQAARLAVSDDDRAASLLEAGITAFASGSPSEGQKLVDAAADAGMDDAARLLSAVVRATFIDGEPPHPLDGAGMRRVLDRLRECALGPVAFSVLAANVGSWANTRWSELEVPAWLPSTAKKSVAALQAGDLPTATRLLSELADQLADSGLRGVETHARALLADSAARTGDLPTAAEQARQAQELAWATRQRAWRVHASVTEALVGALRGVPDSSELLEAAHRSVLCEEGEARLLVELAHAVSLTAAEQWGDAFAILMDLGCQVTAYPAVLDFGLLGHLAEAALHTRREAEARSVVSRVAESSGGSEPGSAFADLLHAQALLATDADSDACFGAVQSISAADWPWLRARSDLARGGMLRRRRRIVEARAHLLSAQRLFQAIGSPVWERRSHDELRAAGMRDSRPDRTRGTSGWTHLTPQEQEIVRLAADGLTNRQIGERLFLSPRTIGAHLYRTFPKLDITSRTQLARLDLSS